jgi:O-antigen/teichoic acid export membrane protein
MTPEERIDLPGLTEAEPTAVLDTERAGPLAVRGGILRAAGHAAGILLSAGSAALMIRALGVVDTGHYVTIISLITIAAGLTEAGLATIGVREYAQRAGAARERALRNLLGVRLALAAAGVGGALAFAAIAGFDDRLMLGTAIAGAGMAVVAVHGTYTVPLAAALRLGTITALELLRQSLFVALVAAVALTGGGLLMFLAVPIPASLAVLVWALWLVRRMMPLLPAAQWSEWARLLRQVLPVAAAVAMGVLYFRIVMVITSLVTTAEETGYFAASFRVVEVLLMVPGILVSSAFPILARAAGNDRARLRYALQRLFEGSLIAGAGIAVLIVVGAPVAVDVIAGARFQESVAVLRIQGLALAATFFIATWSYALLSLHAHRALLAANAAALAVSVTLAMALAPEYGAQGAAVATLGAEMVLVGACLLMLVRRRPDLRPEIRLAPRVLAAVTPALAVPLALGIPALPGTLLAAGIYSTLVLLLRAVPAELWEALPRRARGSAGSDFRRR